MIGKQVKGKDFLGCLAYVLEKPGAQLIGGNMEGMTPQALAIEFEQVRQRSLRVQRPVYHCALSLSPGEHLFDEVWQEIADRYLKAMGFQRNQYVLARHTDTENHEHVHIVANRVQRSGQVVTDSWDFRRSEAVLRQLESEYALVPVTSSWKSDRAQPTRREIEKGRTIGKSSVRQQLQHLIDHTLNQDRLIETITDLSDRLKQMGVSTRLNCSVDGQPRGISFELNGIAIAGTKLGRAYSLPRLQQRLAGGVPSVIDRAPPSATQQIRRLLNQTIQHVASIPQLVEHLQTSGVPVQIHQSPRGQRLLIEVEGKTINSARLGKLYHLQTLKSRLEHQAVSLPVSMPQTIKTSSASGALAGSGHLNTAHQKQVYQHLYETLAQRIRKRSQHQQSTREVDLEIAQFILQSGSNTDIKALVHSPQVQQISQKSGREQAEAYVQELLKLAAQNINGKNSQHANLLNHDLDR
ncbi:relaxase/mobilization nuclease domain-containing protein [Phormidesmis sp. 146-35]